MSGRHGSEPPRPPATAEFGHVEVGGAPHAYPPDGPFAVTKLAVGPWSNNVYVLAAGGEALIIDGADEPERILDLVRGLRVVGIVETHNHPDHVQALPALVEALGVPVHAHPADPVPVPAEPLEDGQRLSVGGHEVEAIHTPGHTPGSTCFLAGRRLFSGDTLFPGGPGNTDGDAARFVRIMASLGTLFARMDDDVAISPGHGLDTTFGRERPHIGTWLSRGW